MKKCILFLLLLVLVAQAQVNVRTLRDGDGVKFDYFATYNADNAYSFVHVSKSFELAVVMGQVPGHSAIDKFGENPDIDAGTTPEDIWEGEGLYVYDQDSTAPIRFMSSSDAGDVGNIIKISGLDSLGNEISVTSTTNGHNNVDLPETFWRVFRAENESPIGGDLNGMLYVHRDNNPTSGVPAQDSIRAIINNGNNQTLMSLYTVAKGKVGFLYRGEIMGSRSSTSGEIQAAYYSRRYGKVFKVKKRVNVTNSGSSVYQDRRSFPDPIPALTDIRLTIESVSSNNVGVTGTFDILIVDETQFTVGYLIAIGQPGFSG